MSGFNYAFSSYSYIVILFMLKQKIIQRYQYMELPVHILKTIISFITFVILVIPVIIKLVKINKLQTEMLSIV